jgi:hypothetical protein
MRACFAAKLGAVNKINAYVFVSFQERLRRTNPVSSASPRVQDCFAEPVIGRAFARPGGSQ